MIDLYTILENSLKGKKIEIRSYKDTTKSFIYESEMLLKVVDWEENEPYLKWIGVVYKVLQNDNSRVDIIFDRKYPREFPSTNYLEDCYNLHMNTYIKILDE